MRPLAPWRQRKDMWFWKTTSMIYLLGNVIVTLCQPYKKIGAASDYICIDYCYATSVGWGFLEGYEAICSRSHLPCISVVFFPVGFVLTMLGSSSHGLYCLKHHVANTDWLEFHP